MRLATTVLSFGNRRDLAVNSDSELRWCQEIGAEVRSQRDRPELSVHAFFQLF